MNTLTKLPDVKAREAIEALEQAYAYYTPKTPTPDARKAQVEYYEYAPAA